MTIRMRIFLFVLLFICPAVIAEERLSDQRWSEEAFGLSVRAPLGARVIENPPGNVLVAFEDVDGTQITLTIKQVSEPIDIEGLIKRASQQLTIPYPSWLPMEDTDPLETIANRPAGRMYVLLPDKDHGDRVLGHAFVLIDPFTFVNLQWSCPASTFDASRVTFDAVARSIELMDPVELDRIRTEQLEAGDAWLATVDRGQMLKHAPEELWLRMLDGRDLQDRGYMRLRIKPSQELGLQGTHIDIRRHLDAPNHTLDTAEGYFESADDSTEVWSSRATRRANTQAPVLPGNTKPNNQTISTAMTGLRNNDRIDVTVESLTRVEPKQWQTPVVAYLSKVDRYLIGHVLPKQATRLAFYSYNTQVGSIALMTVRTEPIRQGPQRGGYRAFVREAPTLGEQVVIYNADGELVEWTTADGWVLKPATPQEMKRIWQVKD